MAQFQLELSLAQLSPSLSSINDNNNTKKHSFLFFFNYTGHYFTILANRNSQKAPYAACWG